MQLQAWLNEMLNDLFEDMFRYKGIFSIKAEEGDDFEVVFQVGTSLLVSIPSFPDSEAILECILPC